MSHTEASAPSDLATSAGPAEASVTWPDRQRERAFEAWLRGISASHGLDGASLRPASADASFRRYFRIDARQGSLIIMDAPTQQEDSPGSSPMPWKV